MTGQSSEERNKIVAYLKRRAAHFTFLGNVKLKNEPLGAIQRYRDQAQGYRDAAYEIEHFEDEIHGH